MGKTTILKIQLDEQGHLMLPEELLSHYGIFEGAKVRLNEDSTGFSFSRSTDNLARVYIEPTNICNLDCRTCMRHGWDEPLGRMTSETFARILEGIDQLPLRPEIFFGGFGEPLSHPDILAMVAAAKGVASKAWQEPGGGHLLLQQRFGSHPSDAGGGPLQKRTRRQRGGDGMVAAAAVSQDGDQRSDRADPR